ncbi:unnamed protein product [Caenorhabditis sp. 36 PRJEB53466]|nr:unnamed protein product [Caenorhabditis sp. 36 PRJEB53466]
MIDASGMYKLTVMNMTTAAIEQTDAIFRAALIIEWILISIGFGETILLWYLLRYTNQYHRNLAMIVEQLPNQYFPSLLARMFMIYKQLMITDTGMHHRTKTRLRLATPLSTLLVAVGPVPTFSSSLRKRCTEKKTVLIEDRSFLFAVWLRNSLLFVAFYFAPFPVFERCFATIYMLDYETHKRRWISYILTAILYVIALTSAHFFIFGSKHREIHIFVITGFNLLAFGLTFVMERYNKRRYSALRKNINSEYSLSARTQLSENINSTLPFKVMCFSIAFFASTCTSMLHVDEWTDSPVIRNWVYIAFNFCCWSYGTVVPLFMLAYNPQWQKELRRLGRKFCCCFCSLNRVNTTTSGEGDGGGSERKKQTTRVKDTFGNNCYVDDKEHTTIYFSQLNADWNRLEEPQDVQHNAKRNRLTARSRSDGPASTVTARSISNGSVSPRQIAF